MAALLGRLPPSLPLASSNGARGRRERERERGRKSELEVEDRDKRDGGGRRRDIWAVPIIIAPVGRSNSIIGLVGAGHIHALT